MESNTHIIDVRSAQHSAACISLRHATFKHLHNTHTPYCTANHGLCLQLSFNQLANAAQKSNVSGSYKAIVAVDVDVAHYDY